MKPATPIESKAYWEHHIQQLNVSGLSRKQYCAKHGVIYDRFPYWIKKLSLPASTIKPSSQQTLVAVKVLPKTFTTNTPLCTLHFQNATVLHIYSTDALDLLLTRMS